MHSQAPVALITGASRGIGAATALAFGRAGWRVAITARSQSEGQQLAHQLRRPDGAMLAGSLATTMTALENCGVTAFSHTMDLLDPASLDAAADAVLNRFGRVDALINNAVYQDREMNARLNLLDDAALERTLYGNVVAPFHLVRRLLPGMLEQGHGQIINVCSGAGKSDPPFPADQGGWGFAYGASKAAMARMSGCINLEHGKQGISAFSVNPGVVTTEAVTATLGNNGELQRRLGALSPEAIAAALLFLCTDERARALNKSPVMLDLKDVVQQFDLH